MMTANVVNIFLVSVCCIISPCLGDKQMVSEGDKISLKLVGCFDETYEYQDFPYNVTDSNHHLIPDACIEICLKQYFRFVL